jgi:diguanylate cyclase (GGDEF)-like protein
VDLSDRIRLEETVHLREQQLQLARQRLTSASATDPVTGARNRAAFFEDLASHTSHALQRKQALSLALVDIDHFKAFNIEQGQRRGDELLKRVAVIARYTARGSDLLSRAGADVFTLILPETDAEGAIRFAERLQAAIKNAEWPYRPVTVSIGVSTLDPAADSAERPATTEAEHPSADDLRSWLHNQAEQALAAAKTWGRARSAHARELTGSQPV